MTIRLFAATAATAIALIAPGTALAATSCFDLWYARNAIYDENGYCFSTERGREYFDNSDCWIEDQADVELSEIETHNVDEIVEVEQEKGCE